MMTRNTENTPKKNLFEETQKDTRTLFKIQRNTQTPSLAPGSFPPSPSPGIRIFNYPEMAIFFLPFGKESLLILIWNGRWGVKRQAWHTKKG